MPRELRFFWGKMPRELRFSRGNNSQGIEFFQVKLPGMVAAPGCHGLLSQRHRPDVFFSSRGSKNSGKSFRGTGFPKSRRGTALMWGPSRKNPENASAARAVLGQMFCSILEVSSKP